jgi:hypothetical protein
MTVEGKIKKEAMVKKYLQELFPGCDVQTEWHFKSKSLLFSIDGVDRQIKHCGRFSKEFLEYTKVDEIRGELNKRKIKQMMDEMGTTEVLIKS